MGRRQRPRAATRARRAPRAELEPGGIVELEVGQIGREQAGSGRPENGSGRPRAPSHHPGAQRRRARRRRDPRWTRPRSPGRRSSAGRAELARQLDGLDLAEADGGRRRLDLDHHGVAGGRTGLPRTVDRARGVLAGWACCSCPGAAHGEAVDADRRQADADRNGLAVLAAHADALVELRSLPTRLMRVSTSGRCRSGLRP